jgi:hypothetical protein
MALFSHKPTTGIANPQRMKPIAVPREFVAWPEQVSEFLPSPCDRLSAAGGSRHEPQRGGFSFCPMKRT